MISSKMLEKNISQKPALQLFKKLGYTYISPNECNKQRENKSNCILKEILKNQLKKINSFKYNQKKYQFSDFNFEKAISDLDVPIHEGLVIASEKIYNKLIMGNSYEEKVDDKKKLSFNMKYIDWDNINNNVFHVTDEFEVNSYIGNNKVRIDLVLFINGIPFATIEFKSGIKSINDAIEQNIRNQNETYIPQLFKYTSLIVASNKNEVKYGTTRTKKEFYSEWNYKNDEKEYIEKKVENLYLQRQPTYQDYIFTTIMSPERLLEISRYFILFDTNVKKICRYQQYYGVVNAIKTISEIDDNRNRKSGVIWHTQGSGKSLTMVMLTNYILTKINPGISKVIVVTDRKELDKQITKTFNNTKIEARRATSGQNLIDLIKQGKSDVIISTINKFNTVEKFNTENSSQDIFVLVDESHRTNYGEFATKMRRVFPNACYIGFTGTPLMKNDKTLNKFGGNYIHKYTIKEGVDDHAIVPLIYEGRFIEQNVDNNNIDLWFKKTCEKLTEKQKDDLTRKWSSIKKINSSNARIDRIALDIDEHFVDNIKERGFKAILATNSKLDAVRYYNSFKSFSDLNVAVCISSPDTREGYEDDDESNLPELIKFWKDMMKDYLNAENYEDSVKNKFCDGEIDIMIVCSKLLTGFDAPICQVIYIDKQLKDHGLLQAIARTNRVYEGKDYGLIIDYNGLLQKINSAINIYSGNNGLDLFNKKDLSGLVIDVLDSVSKLRQSYSILENNFINIKNKEDEEEYELYLEKDENKRVKFYDDLCNFSKNLSLVISSEKAYWAIADNNPDEIKNYKDKFKFYSKLRIMIKKRCAETIDSKNYEKEMRNLLDKHLSVRDLEILISPLNIMNKNDVEKELELLCTNSSKADTIKNTLSKHISINYEKDPNYYESFSKRIKNVLKQYKEHVINDAKYLQEMQNILKDYQSKKSGINYPELIDKNEDAKAYYGTLVSIIKEFSSNFDKDIIAEISLKISEIIKENIKIDWLNNTVVHDDIMREIDKYIYSRLVKTNLLKITNNQIDKIIDKVILIAKSRFN